MKARLTKSSRDVFILAIIRMFAPMLHDGTRLFDGFLRFEETLVRDGREIGVVSRRDDAFTSLSTRNVPRKIPRGEVPIRYDPIHHRSPLQQREIRMRRR